MTGLIKYITGDATKPQPIDPENPNENIIIAHICNNKGGWGSGFVVPLGKKFPLAEKGYRRWATERPNNMPSFELGKVQLIEAEDSIFVANMIAQHDMYPVACSAGDIPPIRYDRVRQCLNKVAKMAKGKKASVHMPRIGCGLAGGTWQVIEGLIKETLLEQDIEVVIYSLDGDTSWK